MLKRDLDNRLLDFQRERCQAERLQKQLDDKGKHHEQLKNLLKEYQMSLATQLTRNEGKLSHMLSVGDSNECRYGKITPYYSLYKSHTNSVESLSA